VAVPLNNLALVRFHSGDLERAADMLRESLAIQRGQGNAQGVAAALTNLGNIARIAGRTDEAGAHLDEALGLCR
jgi:hypothetical protein